MLLYYFVGTCMDKFRQFEKEGAESRLKYCNFFCSNAAKYQNQKSLFPVMLALNGPETPDTVK